MLCACGPDVAPPAADASGGGSTGTSPTSESSSGGVTTTSDDTTGSDACEADAYYCFERIEIRDFDPSAVTKADLLGSGKRELVFSSLDDLWIWGWEGGPSPTHYSDPTAFSPARLRPGEPEQLLGQAGRSVYRDAIVAGELVSTEDPIEGYERSLSRDLVFDFEGDERPAAVLAYEELPFNGNGFQPHLLELVDGVWRPHTLAMPDLRIRRAEVDKPAAYGDFGAGAGHGLVVVHDVLTDDVDPVSYPQTEYDPERNQVVALALVPGGFEEVWRGPTGLLATMIDLHDLTGDGVSDLVLRRDRWALAVAEGLGNGRFSEPIELDLSPYDVRGGGSHVVTGVVVGDVEGDGEPELLLRVVAEDTKLGDVVAITDPLGAAELRSIALGDAAEYGPLAIEDADGEGDSEILFRANDGGETFLVLLKRVP